MSRLNEKQQELIFDYSLGIASEDQAQQAEKLISSNPNAANFYKDLQDGLSPLDSLPEVLCPDDLVERTVIRLNHSVHAEGKLRELIANEQKEEQTAGSLWINIGRRLAAAAVFVIFATALLTGVNLMNGYARQKAWQQMCQMQLKRIHDGTSAYIEDNDGQLPSVAASGNSPWWKVGYQGKENHSNTRNLWLLVTNDYVEASDFVCPGSKHKKSIEVIADPKSYHDFPSRKHITYSARIKCSKTNPDLFGRKVLISDLNPLFENIPETYTKSFHLVIDREKLNANSSNHNKRGQNVLFCDGSVDFVETRRIGLSKDDIFTLRNTKVYEGTEVPTCETDAFLAP